MLSAAAVTVASATPLATTHSVTGSANAVHSLHNGTIGVPNHSGFSDSDAAASSPREFSSDQTASDEGSADEASYERPEDRSTRRADAVVTLGQFQPLKEPTSKTEDVPPLGSKDQQPVTMKPTADQWNLMKVRVGFDVTRKGERSLVIDGYKFTKSRDGMSDRVFWRCSRRECKATAVTVSDRVEHVRTLHTHKPPLAGEFFVESAGGAKLQTVRFNYAPSSTKPRARRRVLNNSQQALPQDATKPAAVNREEAESTADNGETTVTSSVAPTNIMTTTATASVANNCVSNAGYHEQERHLSAGGDGDSTNLQAQAVAAILSSLMERRAAAYQKDNLDTAGRHYHQPLEATEYRDSLSNQHTESHSKLTARQYAVSSLSCLLGMNDRRAVVSAHLSPPNPSPPVYTHASRDPSVPHSDNHYQSLGQYNGVNLQQQQAKRDSQNSTPDPPFEVSMHSPPPPLPPPTGYPTLVPISPPLTTQSPERAPLSYHDLLSRGTAVAATPTAKLTDLASLASSIRPALAPSECPANGGGSNNERSQIHTTLAASTAATDQTTTVNLGSAVGLLGKAVLGQLVFLSGDQLKELSTASSSSSTGSHYRVRHSSHADFLLSPPSNTYSAPADPAFSSPLLPSTDTGPNSACSSEQLRGVPPPPFSSSPRPTPVGIPHKELHSGRQLEPELRLQSNYLPGIYQFAETAATTASAITTSAETISDPQFQPLQAIADYAATPHVQGAFGGRSEVAQTPNNFPSVGMLHWKKEKMRESEEAAAAHELEHGRRRHFTAFSQHQTPVVALRRKRCASDCHMPQSRGVAFSGLHDFHSASSTSAGGSEAPRSDRTQGRFSSDANDWCTQIQDDVLAKILNTVQQLTARLDGDSDPPEVIQNCKAIQACLDTIHALKRARYDPGGACARPLPSTAPQPGAEHSSTTGYSASSDMLNGLPDPRNQGLP